MWKMIEVYFLYFRQVVYFRITTCHAVVWAVAGIRAQAAASVFVSCQHSAHRATRVLRRRVKPGAYHTTLHVLICATNVSQWSLTVVLCCHGYNSYARELSIVQSYQPSNLGYIKWHVPYCKMQLWRLYMAVPPVGVQAPNGARPYADTMLTTKSQMFPMMLPL